MKRVAVAAAVAALALLGIGCELENGDPAIEDGGGY